MHQYYADAKHATFVQTFLNFTSSTLSAAFIVIPFAMHSLGLPVTVTLFLVLGALNYYTLTSVVVIAEDFRKHSYEEVAELAFGRIGFLVAWTTELLFGLCAAVVNIFVASTLIAHFLHRVTGGSHSWAISRGVVAVWVALPGLAFSLYQHPRRFSLAMGSAIVATVVFALCLFLLWAVKPTRMPSMRCWILPHGLNSSLKFGVVLLYCFVAHHKCFWNFRSMRLRSKERWSLVCRYAIGCTILLYLLISAVGMLCLPQTKEEQDDRDFLFCRDSYLGSHGLRVAAFLGLAAFLVLISPTDVSALRLLVTRMLARNIARLSDLDDRSEFGDETQSAGSPRVGYHPANLGEGQSWAPGEQLPLPRSSSQSSGFREEDLERICGQDESEDTHRTVSSSAATTSATASALGRSGVGLAEQPEPEPRETLPRHYHSSSVDDVLPPTLGSRPSGLVTGGKTHLPPPPAGALEQSLSSPAPPLTAAAQGGSGGDWPLPMTSRMAASFDVAELRKQASTPDVNPDLVERLLSQEELRHSIDTSSFEECPTECRSSMRQSSHKSELMPDDEEGAARPLDEDLDISEHLSSLETKDYRDRFCGTPVEDCLHFALTVVIWAVIVAAAACLDTHQVILLVSCVSGYGASILAFIMPAACYFRLAPISSDFRAVPIFCGWVPNQVLMAVVLFVGVFIFLLRSYMAVACMLEQGNSMCYHGQLTSHRTIDCEHGDF